MSSRVAILPDSLGSRPKVFKAGGGRSSVSVWAESFPRTHFRSAVVSQTLGDMSGTDRSVFPWRKSVGNPKGLGWGIGGKEEHHRSLRDSRSGLHGSRILSRSTGSPIF